MKFNTALPDEKKSAFSYFMKLANKKQIIEVKKISPNRTLKQNSYLHLLITYFAVHFGLEVEEAKVIYKDWNKELYVYHKETKFGRNVFYRSSSALTMEEMAKSIDHFRMKSAEEGCPLPPATDKEWIKSIENAIEQASYYVR